MSKSKLKNENKKLRTLTIQRINFLVDKLNSIGGDHNEKECKQENCEACNIMDKINKANKRLSQLSKERREIKESFKKDEVLVVQSKKDDNKITKENFIDPPEKHSKPKKQTKYSNLKDIFDLQKFRIDRARGLNFQEIAAADYEVSGDYLRCFCIKEGYYTKFSAKEHFENSGKDLNELITWEKFLDMKYNEKLTNEQISDIYRCGLMTLYRWISKNKKERGIKNNIFNPESYRTKRLCSVCRKTKQCRKVENDFFVCKTC
jgi:DNA gyrase/topoisomerase IV subunit A